MSHLCNILLRTKLLLIGRWLALRLSAFVARLLERNQADKTVVGFLSKSVYVATLLLAFLVALSWLGIPTTSIIAVLGAGTLAIGLALQDSLSNLASGLLLIFLKPFVRTKDYDATRADLLEQIKLRFDEAGIMPNPQRAVQWVRVGDSGESPYTPSNSGR